MTEHEIGEIVGELKGINRRLDNQNGQIREFAKVLKTLPCHVHNERLKNLEGIETKRIKWDERTQKQTSNRRSQIIAAVMGALVSGVVILAIRLAT